MRNVVLCQVAQCCLVSMREESEKQEWAKKWGSERRREKGGKEAKAGTKEQRGEEGDNKEEEGAKKDEECGKEEKAGHATEVGGLVSSLVHLTHLGEGEVVTRFPWVNLRKDHSHMFRTNSCELFCGGLCEDSSGWLMQMLEGGGGELDPLSVRFCCHRLWHCNLFASFRAWLLSQATYNFQRWVSRFDQR